MYHLQQISFKLIVKNANFVFLLDSTEGRELFKVLQNYGLKQEAHFIGIGLDTKFLNLPSKGKKYDGVHIGMRPNKGIFDLPEIWYQVVQKRKNAKIALIGGMSDSLKKDLEAKFASLGLNENIEFLGFIDEAKKHETLKESVVFIAPSHEESWGIAVGEAMLCKLPVVAYRLEAYEDVYGDVISYVNYFDKKEFAEKVLELFENDKKRNILTTIGYEKASEYTWEKVLSEDLRILKGKDDEKVQKNNRII